MTPILRFFPAAILAAFSLPLSCLAQPNAPSGLDAAKTADPRQYRRLPDIVMFEKDPLGGFANGLNGGALETASGLFPVDAAQTFQGRPSYRVRYTGAAGGGWEARLPRSGWQVFDIAAYRENGALEFNIKGEKGGETFRVGLSDAGGPKGESVVAPLGEVSGDFGPVTTQWRRVRIPLKKLIPGASPLRLAQMSNLSLQSADGAASQTFWLNDIRFTSPDAEKSRPAIKINQWGFAPGAKKRALVTDFPENLTAKAGTAFSVYKAGTKAVVFSGKLTLLAENDAEISGEKILAADFSAFKTPGRYIIHVDAPGEDASPPFTIGADLYKPLLRDAARYYYLQRSGMALSPQCARQFARGEGHPQDRALALQSDPDGPKRDVSGGWYDAGDYGKYVSMCAVPISDLLWSQEIFPAQFPDGQLNIPESGNRVPDILDEVRWELTWLLKMQDAASGGFYQKVWPNNAGATPDKDPQTRYIYDRVNGKRQYPPYRLDCERRRRTRARGRLLRKVRPDVRQNSSHGGGKGLGLPQGQPR